jgi:SAM-dependent methyltransferase
VLDGIPIITQQRLAHRSIADDRVVADGGPEPGGVVELLEAGEGLRALLSVLAWPICPWPFNTFGRFRRFSTRAPHSNWTLALRKRRLRKMLARRGELTAEDWFAAFYLHSPVPHDAFNYFFFRFSQPRHLAALSLVSVIAEGQKAILDLACGYGTILHSLTFENDKVAIGLDQNFHQVWLAKHYVAPGAAFVCADAMRPLPFADGTFSAAYCTDAFHYVQNKADVLAELRRCSGAGPVLLAPVGNALVEPKNFHELSPVGYANLLSDWQWRVRSERDLIAGYLEGKKPDLTASSSDEEVAGSKFLYYAAAGDDTLFRDHGEFEKLPHMVGYVQINPLYSAKRNKLYFRFPSRWFGIENRAMLDYMPRSVSIDETPKSKLAKKCVLIGLPKHYARPSGRFRVFFVKRFFNAHSGPLLRMIKRLIGK